MATRRLPPKLKRPDLQREAEQEFEKKPAEVTAKVSTTPDSTVTVDDSPIFNASTTGSPPLPLPQSRPSSWFSAASAQSLLPEISMVMVTRAGDPAAEPVRLGAILAESEVTIVSFLRRFGCPVCRAVATGLSYVKRHVFDKMGVRLIAIAIEDIGYEEFARKQYFAGDIFINAGGCLFQALSLKRLGVHNIFGILELKKMQAAVALSANEHFNDTRDFQGDYAQLGGFFIISGRGQNVIYEFRETYAGDTPLVGDVLDALNTPLDLRTRIDGSLRILQVAQEALKERTRAQLVEKQMELLQADIPEKYMHASPKQATLRTRSLSQSPSIASIDENSISDPLKRPISGFFLPMPSSPQKLTLSMVYGNRLSPLSTPSSPSRSEHTDDYFAHRLNIGFGTPGSQRSSAADSRASSEFARQIMLARHENDDPQSDVD